MWNKTGQRSACGGDFEVQVHPFGVFSVVINRDNVRGPGSTGRSSEFVSAVRLPDGTLDPITASDDAADVFLDGRTAKSAATRWARKKAHELGNPPFPDVVFSKSEACDLVRLAVFTRFPGNPLPRISAVLSDPELDQVDPVEAAARAAVPLPPPCRTCSNARPGLFSGRRFANRP